MTWIALIALAVYAALKSGQFAFLGGGAGYREEPAGMCQRMRKGEPALLIVATLLTVPPALAGTWYHKHKFEKVLNHSVACYGSIYGYRDAPEIKRSNGEHAVYESISGYRSTALGASWQLGLNAPVTQRRLDRIASVMAIENRQAAHGVRRARLSATQHCLHPLLAGPNA